MKIKRSPFLHGVRKPLLPWLFLWGSLALLPGCLSLGSSPGNSWSSKNRSKMAGTLRLETVSVDKPVDKASIEKEIRGRAPLIFLKQGYLLVPEGEATRYRADIRAIEREYVSGWKTRRSLSMEVFIWQDEAESRDPVPLASGRAAGAGQASLSSSPVVDRLLKTAVKRALGALKK
ncbi:hypothetical protein LQZ21_04940 [Treponema sp. TIM-1]|uniref:hypothetical protein n=1 Tax=Treponema sp. TIM-1 TaxID=2898417 RepID=UPI00397EC14C